jgi:F0F1-type ATP synthase membrane subunit b/b'
MRPPLALPPLLEQARSSAVKDYRASIEKLRTDAAEAALIRDLATDKAKRDLYDNLHTHFNRLADEVCEP